MESAAAGRLGLLLPVLGEDIPSAVHSPEAYAANARLARFLLDAGAVRERDVPRRWRDPLVVCEAALQRWLGKHLGALRCLAPQFSLSLASDEDAHDAVAVQCSERVCIRWGESGVLRWEIGAGLEWLERHEPGLGAAVLSVIDAGAGRLYPLFTPRVALDVASFLYWHGEEDEALALTEMYDTPDDMEAMRTEMVTLDAMREAFPRWALEPMRRADSYARLRRVASSGTGLASVRRTVELAMKLARLPSRADYAPEAEGIFIGFGAVLCWRPDDLAMQISDDLAQYAWQDDYVDHAGEASVRLDDPAALALWQRRMRPLLRGIAILDALIWMLAEGYCLQEKGVGHDSTFSYRDGRR